MTRLAAGDGKTSTSQSTPTSCLMPCLYCGSSAQALRNYLGLTLKYTRIKHCTSFKGAMIPQQCVRGVRGDIVSQGQTLGRTAQNVACQQKQKSVEKNRNGV